MEDFRSVASRYCTLVTFCWCSCAGITPSAIAGWSDLWQAGDPLVASQLRACLRGKVGPSFFCTAPVSASLGLASNADFTPGCNPSCATEVSRGPRCWGRHRPASQLPVCAAPAAPPRTQPPAGLALRGTQPGLICLLPKGPFPLHAPCRILHLALCFLSLSVQKW